MAYYTYLVASLPMLNFGSKPPLGLKEFLARCAELLGDKDYRLIRNAVSTQGFALDGRLTPALLRWKAFDLALRNELAKARAARRKTDASRFLRGGQASAIQAMHLAQTALRQPNILEAEKYLDGARWHELDEIASGHYFDLEFLLVYALKLVILERQSMIGTEAAGWEGTLLKDKDA